MTTSLHLCACTYYEYEFNRLIKIDYPNSPDVTFEYGAWYEAGPISYYRASRIKEETSEAGAKELTIRAQGPPTADEPFDGCALPNLGGRQPCDGSLLPDLHAIEPLDGCPSPDLDRG